MEAYVNIYYSEALTEDEEGSLVILCDDCRRTLAKHVDGFAGEGDETDRCQECNAAQPEAVWA